MSNNRFSLLTIKSFTAISKVRSSNNPSNSAGTIVFLRNIGTATDRLELQSPNEYGVESSSGHFQNSPRFYDSSQNHTDFGQYSSGQGLNPNRGFRENPRNDAGNYWRDERGNFGRVRGENTGDWQHNFNGNFQSYGGANWESNRGDSKVDAVEKNRSFSGYNVNNNRQSQLYQNEVGVSSSRDSAGGGYRGDGNLHTNNGSFNGYYGNHNGQSQLYQNEVGVSSSRDSAGGGYRGDENLYTNNGSFSGYYRNYNRQSHLYDNKIHVPTSRDSPGEGYGGGNTYVQNAYGSYQSGGQSYHNSNGHYTGNVGRYPHAPGAGQYQQKHNVGQYQPNVNANQHPVNLNHPSRIGSTHVAEQADSSESNPNIGTLEELDGFCKEGKCKEAVEVLRLLGEKSVSVDLPRYFQLMQACGESKALDEAKVVHDLIVRSLSPLEVGMYNKILEMYSNCGAMDDAFSVFDRMQEQNLDSWNTMITGLAKNDHGEDAIDLFTQFKLAGQIPDAQMFSRVFYACSVLGDINEGMLHFESMRKNYHILPSMEHYVGIVNMLGSNGYLDEALEFIEKMPMEPSVDVWETLMNLCRIHGNLELGARCAELVEQIDPSRLSDQCKAGLVPVKSLDHTKDKEKKKLASQSILEARSRVHEYRAGDTSHPNNDKLYALLKGLREQMKEAGYIPETRFVLHDIDQEGKEDALLAHSERLATAQGLLTSAARSPIRVIKNLRVCGDCHNAIKIISKIVGRELIMRDAKRFHHFKDGVCSCRDYW